MYLPRYAAERGTIMATGMVLNYGLESGPRQVRVTIPLPYEVLRIPIDRATGYSRSDQGETIARFRLLDDAKAAAKGLYTGVFVYEVVHRNRVVYRAG